MVLVVKNPPANAGDVRDTGSVPGWGRCPGGGHGNPLQYSHLEHPMDRGAWWAMVHGVTKSWTQLSNLTQQHISLAQAITKNHRLSGLNTNYLFSPSSGG